LPVALSGTFDIRSIAGRSAGCREARLPARGWLLQVQQSPAEEDTEVPGVQLLLAVPSDGATRPPEDGAAASVVWNREFASPQAAEFHDASVTLVDTPDLDGDGTGFAWRATHWCRCRPTSDPGNRAAARRPQCRRTRRSPSKCPGPHRNPPVRRLCGARAQADLCAG